MRLTNGRTLATAAGATGVALMLAACDNGNGVDGIDDGLGQEDIVNGEAAPEPDDTDDTATDNGAADEDAPMIVLAGDEHNFQMRCVSDPDEPGAVIISTVGTDVDALSGSFGFEGREDRLYVTLDNDGPEWGVSDSLGEFLSVDIGPDGDYVVGEATFETQDGDTETGTFNLVC